MLFAGLGSVRIVKNCDRGLENAARGRRPRVAFSSPRSQFFTIRTDPKPANSVYKVRNTGVKSREEMKYQWHYLQVLSLKRRTVCYCYKNHDNGYEYVLIKV